MFAFKMQKNKKNSAKRKSFQKSRCENSSYKLTFIDFAHVNFVSRLIIICRLMISSLNSERKFFFYMNKCVFYQLKEYKRIWRTKSDFSSLDSSFEYLNSHVIVKEYRKIWRKKSIFHRSIRYSNIWIHTWSWKYTKKFDEQDFFR